jgi:ABC-type spermidine/putrescine transport systems, ATPase components
VLAGTVENIEQGFCRVALASGGTVMAQAVNVAGAGAATSLSVRPERISILTDGAAGDGPNRLPATVQNTIYLGDHALAVLRGRRQRGVHGQASAGRAWRPEPRPKRVHHLPPEDCLALDPV